MASGTGRADYMLFGVGCASSTGPAYHLLMKVATGTVVKGTIIVDDPEFKDGTGRRVLCSLASLRVGMPLELFVS